MVSRYVNLGICAVASGLMACGGPNTGTMMQPVTRSEEHTSELQSHSDLVCRLLLEKKKPKPASSRFQIFSQGTSRCGRHFFPPPLLLASSARRQIGEWSLEDPRNGGLRGKPRSAAH